jgi:nicotinamidase-related amidase
MTMLADNSPAVRLLDAERTALLVIDLQRKLLPAIADHERVLGNCVLLLRLARVLDLPVVLTTQYAKGLGETVAPIAAELPPDVQPLDKTSFGCFGDEGFRRCLNEIGRQQLLVCGIESHICVAQTVLGALEAGHDVHVAQDAVGSRSEANRQVGLKRMERAGALISSAEMAIYELLRRSDGETFKRMLPYLKGQE